MREVVLQVWCDECGDNEAPLSETEAIHVEITLDNPKGTWELDLCEKHADALLQEARPVGRKTKVPPSNAYICEICGFAAKTPGGHGLHMTRKHGEETDHD